MGLEFINKLPTPAEIREQFPIPAELAALKEKRDAEIRKIITGESDKFLVIIGPCSVRLHQPPGKGTGQGKG